MKIININFYKYRQFLIIIIFILFASFISSVFYYKFFEIIYNLSYLYFFMCYFIIILQKGLYIIINMFITISFKFLFIIIVPLLIIIKISIKLIKYMLLIFLSLIPGLNLIIAFVFNIIVFFVEMITHNYAFMWGDKLFQDYYNLEFYGKIIIFFCDLITSIVVYVLYILYIPAIALFLMYHILYGYSFWFYFLFHLPFIKDIPLAIWVLCIGMINFIMDEIENDKLFFSWVILYCLPGTYWFFYREYVGYLIEVYMDSYLYLTQDPDSGETRSKHRFRCRVYRDRVVYYFFVCFLIIQGFKLIFLNLGIPLCFQYFSQYMLYIIISISFIYYIWDIISEYKEYLFPLIYEEYFLEEFYYDYLDDIYAPIKEFITKKRLLFLLKNNYGTYY